MTTTKQLLKLPCQMTVNGMQLLNIGIIDSVELFPDVKLCCLKCTTGSIMSAAFYWMRYDTILYFEPSPSPLIF